jgi:hypothetical protein
MNDNILIIMNKNPLQSLFQTLFPFFIIGIAIAILIGVFIILSYVILWGIGIGIILWLAARIKAYFNDKTTLSQTSKKGRIIEHEE